ncbi:uncharacterized protein A1O5_13225 [Cladophialophora psammophila CBS 110553]|uniref:Uncharacterized protein n=1 Tax=Cladophialophora psammophila CBS 110553 TaxID=1182543 RepID=W9W4P7_9EURO|nr:uncharacterized protein A1O5_13225 [Cladophialophora psammophila CBS 110553]EXJ53554.1 hypothetical protein A1O5_13225 [Cladophialophora psammophila CBS 110553]
MAHDAMTSSEYNSVYDETIERFQRQRVHVPGVDQVLSATEAIQLAQRIYQSVSADDGCLDEIDRELESIRGANLGVALGIVGNVSAIASALLVATPLLGFARRIVGGILSWLLSLLKPYLQDASENSRQNLEWSKLSVEVLAERQSTVLRTIQHIRLTRENTTHHMSAEINEQMSELEKLLAGRVSSIGEELHKRAAQAAHAKRQAMAARHAQTFAEGANTSSGLESDLNAMLTGLRDVLMHLITLLVEGTISAFTWLLERLKEALDYIIETVSWVFS